MHTSWYTVPVYSLIRPGWNPASLSSPPRKTVRVFRLWFVPIAAPDNRPMQVTNSEHSVHDPDVLAGTGGRLFLAWTESVNDRNQALQSRGWVR